jgi:hypothetical protein
MLLCTRVALAQPPAATAPPSGDRVVFLPRFDVYVEASHLVSDDERYVWDARYAGEFDVVDYGIGRTTLFATYHVVLGEEHQLFDPNQGNYILGGRSSIRIGGTEVSGVFYHQSRHMADRVRPFTVAWNMVGGRVARPVSVRRLSLDPRVDVRGVTQHSFVDYRWEVEADVAATYPLTPHVAFISDGNLRRLGVDGTAGRGTQTGARGEAGVRLAGRRGAVDLFVAAERRVDPYPLERGTVAWLSAGFRVLTR